LLQVLKTAKKVVGIKQLRRAVRDGRVDLVFFAKDADPYVITPVRLEIEALDIPFENVDTMAELGRVCGIQVPAAVAAIVHD